MAADELRLELRAVDGADIEAVDRVRQRTPHAHVVERRPGVVDGHDHLAFELARAHAVVGPLHELAGHLGHAAQPVEPALGQHALGLGAAAEKHEGGAFQRRLLAPVAGVAVDLHRMPALPLHKAERPGADGLRGVARRSLGVHDQRRRQRQRKGQQGIGLLQADDELVGADRLHVGHLLEPLLLRVGRAGRQDAAEAGCRHSGVERLAVVKAHAAAQREGVAQAVGGARPLGGQARRHAALGVDHCQPLQHVGVDDLAGSGRRRGRGVEHRRLQLHAQTHAVARRCQRRQAQQQTAQQRGQRELQAARPIQGIRRQESLLPSLERGRPPAPARRGCARCAWPGTAHRRRCAGRRRARGVPPHRPRPLACR